MKSLFAALLAFAFAAAAQAGGEAKTFATTLQPGERHEECLRLEKDEKRPYQWKSDARVDFNIHYHRGNDVFFPVKRDGLFVVEGRFTAPSGEDYCWMWTALDKAAKIEGQIERPR